MKIKNERPSKFWAAMTVLFGALLLLGGCSATISFFGLPVTTFGSDILGAQLGQMAAIFLGLGCGGLALFHGLTSLLRRPSTPMRLAPSYVFYLVFAVVLGLGNVILNFEIRADFLFPPLFLLGAALPTFAVVAWALRRLGSPVSWRHGAIAFVIGSTISIMLALILEGFLAVAAYIFLYPLGELGSYISDTLSFGSSGFLERLFSSPAILVFLLFTAIEAPIPEEFTKALGVTFLGRKRIKNERQAFALGLLSGAGFAIMENMLYEGLYAQWSGWSWGGITLLRGIGAVLHPLGTGIVALGWYRARERSFRELLKSYGLAVGLHTLWNGGFLPFVYLSGLETISVAASTLSLYGEAIEVLLIAFLSALSLGLWYLLRRIVDGLAEELEPALVSVAISPRALALWGLACALIIIPIGAALGPAWRDIQSVLLPGW
jgi:RsiW-degrading membrane proteinase PrsW (M82 family)